MHCHDKIPPEKYCIGCGLCVAVCPQNVLAMAKSADGRLVRKLTNRRQESGRCHLCTDICPALGWALDRLPALPQISYEDQWLESYIAFASDPAVRSRGASGGIITGLLGFLLDEGEIDGVIAVRPHSRYAGMGEGVIVRTAAGLMDTAGSIYGPATLADGICEVWEEDGVYAVVGLPCQLGGLAKAIARLPRLRRRIKLRIGLFCGRSTDARFLECLVAARGRKMSELQAVHFRSGGWWNYGYEFVFGEGTEFYQLGGTRTGLLRLMWDNQVCLPELCAHCHDPLAFEADLAVGDAWLPQFKGMEEGTNLVIARTPAGLNTMKRAAIAGAVSCTPVPDAYIRLGQGGQIRNKTQGFARRVAAAKTLHQWLPSHLREWIGDVQIRVGKRAIIRYAARPLCDWVLVFLARFLHNEGLCIRFLNAVKGG